MDLNLTLLGTAASVPTTSRNTAAALLTRGGQRWLIDCGEGTQRQLLRAGIGLVELDVVLLTHLHGDHYLGLPGLLKTYGLRGRARPLRLVGPRGLSRLFDALAPVIGRLPFRLDLDERDPTRAGTVWEDDGEGQGRARIEAFPTRHSVPSMGYALIEDDRPGHFDVAAARRLGVPAGPQFGVLQRGGSVRTDDGRTVTPEDVLGPPREGRRVVVTGDTEPCGATLDIARGADVLVHESTFLDADRERARETGHSTAREAAVIGREAHVGLLVLTHLSSRCLPREVRAEAEGVLPDVVVARDFDRIEIPLPERGPAVVHPGRRRAAAEATAEARGTVDRLDL